MKYCIYNSSKADKYTCNLLFLDIDECKENNPCRNGATCTNLIGGFECQCSSGYHGDTCDQGKLFIFFFLNAITTEGVDSYYFT